MMSDREETLCVAAVAIASVVGSTVEEQHTAAKCKCRTQWIRPLLCSCQQFAVYELLVSELHGSDEQLYTELNHVSLEDLTFCSPPLHLIVAF